MAALHLLASQSTQLPRAVASIYPYPRETPHPLLSGALRRGKWTHEEEIYAAAIIQYFLSGVLPVQYGTTLRGYIAQQLHCDPMRVSKKLIPGSVFVGVRIDPKIGRRSYYPCPSDTPGLDAHKQNAEHHLAQLREAFIESIEREEQQVQAAVLPQHRLATSPPTPSPQKRKRDTEETASPPPSARFQPTQRPTLPSLTEVLRQNRAVHAQEHYGYPSNSYANASPSSASWEQQQQSEAPLYGDTKIVDRRSQAPPSWGSTTYLPSPPPY